MYDIKNKVAQNNRIHLINLQNGPSVSAFKGERETDISRWHATNYATMGGEGTPLGVWWHLVACHREISVLTLPLNPDIYQMACHMSKCGITKVTHTIISLLLRENICNRNINWNGNVFSLPVLLLLDGTSCFGDILTLDCSSIMLNYLLECFSTQTCVTLPFHGRYKLMQNEDVCVVTIFI